jgi:hypothetical protein
LGYHKAQPDILQEFVAGDPATYGDMWRWDTDAATVDSNHTPQAKDSLLSAMGSPAVPAPVPAPVSVSFPLFPLPPPPRAEDREGPVKPAVSLASSARSVTVVAADAPSNLASYSGGDSLAGTGDGETDDERLSLQDIPMHEISPEPAGGDFYDSDTDSYLSLSVEDGDTGSVNSAAGSQREYGRKYRYRKVLVPSQDQLQSLALRDGENEVAFELPGCPPPLRTQLYVWPPDARIVIFDIEGAITAAQKGGKGWGGFLGASRTAVLHEGVAKLLNNIHRNGYRILYIAQTQTSSSGATAYSALPTKEHLAKVAGLDVKLPPGPVIKSPDSLVRAFGAERTDVFKAAALRGLKGLFPPKHNPYYASFGTRACDMVAFARCGVPEGRIFLVNPESGEIRGGVVNRTLRTSYDQVNELLHEMFPAVTDEHTRKPSASQARAQVQAQVQVQAQLQAQVQAQVGGPSRSLPSTAAGSRSVTPVSFGQEGVAGAGAGGAGGGVGGGVGGSSTAADGGSQSVGHPVSHHHPSTSAAATDCTAGSSSVHTTANTTTNSTMTSGVSVGMGVGMGIKSFATTTTTVAEDSYNDFNFWRLPIRSIENIDRSIDGL